MNIERLKEALELYYKNIKEKFQTAIANEHTLRTDLENLLNTFKPDDIKILQEAKKEEYEEGTPDFKVFKRIDPKEQLTYNLLIGYIETKKLNENLNKIRETNQIKKYLEVSPNIILTDYNRFIHLSYDKVVSEILLFDFGIDDDNKLFKNNITEQKVIEFENFLNNFFLNYEKRKIKTKKELVKVLSSQAFYLSVKTREVIEKKDNRYIKFKKFFNKTFESFKNAVKYEFDIKEFCDVFAQSIAYGLFVAHIEGINIEEEIDLPRLLPKEFDLLAEFIYFTAPSFNIPNEITYTIENIKKTITLIDLKKIEKELSTNANSLSIYLYEDFLKEFDNLRGTEKRKEGGVFYTPEPVVRFIVKSVKKILKDKFGKRGFKDNSVKVLDPATGTGSFLAEVFNSIIEDINSPVLKREMVREYFLNNIYGFELMFVPYIVAHLKLSHILKNKGYTLSEEEKLKIFLTNTLDLDQNPLNLEMPLLLLEEEYEKSKEIKMKKNILVILGNPPYNNKSKNKGEKILKLLETYKQGLNEKKINLDDDYIKFIRFAQWKLLEQNNAKSGILSFVTNNSFIWGRTHRKMRESLYNSFDEIYILNLHGSDKDPKEDKNVFDIKVGVCISIFVKYPEYNGKKKVYYYSTLENGILSREDKFNLLNNNTYDTISWKELEIKEPYYWFIDRDLNNEEYENNENFWRMDRIFNHINSGIQTKRDNISITFSVEEIKKIIEDFKLLDEKSLRNKYNLKDSSGWNTKNAINTIKSYNHIITKIAYRPLDIRYSCISEQAGFIARPRYETSKHLLKDNLGLLFTKSLTSNYFAHSFVVDSIVECGLLSSRTSEFTFIAPLYLYQDNLTEVIKTPNFTKEFRDFISNKPYSNATPEEILAYIYAVLYHPGYRKKYLEYLKFEYPKIPFTDDINIFKKMVNFGKELIDLHLLKKIPEYEEIFINSDTDDYSRTVEKLTPKQRYKDNCIYINKNLFIEGISKEVLEYKIGGYQVIDKWLKYRIDRELELKDLQHLENMVKVIKRTIEIQKDLQQILIKNLN